MTSRSLGGGAGAVHRSAHSFALMVLAALLTSCLPRTKLVSPPANSLLAPTLKWWLTKERHTGSRFERGRAKPR